MSGAPAPPPLTQLLFLSPQTIPIPIKNDNSNVSLEDLGHYNNKYITHLKPIAQTGPNCGLAALAMVSTLTPNVFSINEIFNEAKSRGFTCCGEMFSVPNMKILAELFLAHWFYIEEICNGVDTNKSLITEKLYGGSLMLVPYDADKNHSPCCMDGHKAHWAVVCGVMEGLDGEVYVAARHGKSRYLGIWSLDSLGRSNANLAELDPAKQNDQRQYILPSGGVRAGLSNRFIMLTKK